MNLILDIGNTSAKVYAYDNGKAVDEMHFDKHNVYMLNVFCSKYAFTQGIYSTVVNLPDDLEHALANMPFKMMKLVSDKTPLPIKNMYETPSTLGTDRLAAAVGAYMKSPGSDVLVIDIGTCVTYDFVKSTGEYLGGNISPGVTMRLKALKMFTDRLPLVDRHGDKTEIGTNTEYAIRNGVLLGMEYEINGYISKYSSKYPNLLIYLTGGVKLDLHISKKSGIFADKFIVPDGLNRILEYNNESL